MFSIVLHANIQYAEIPRSEWSRVFDKSYYNTVDYLLRHEVKFHLNITGYTVEHLPGRVLGLIRDGVSTGLLELTGTSYSHAILPLLDLNTVDEQVRLDREVKARVFGVEPRVFWPPELAYDPLLPGVLRRHGYTHVYVDGEALFYTSTNSFFREYRYPLWRLEKARRGVKPIVLNYLLGLWELKKSLSRVRPGKYTIVGVEEIIGIPVWVQLNTLSILAMGGFPFMSTRRASRWVRGLKDVVVYGTDIEFFGYRSIGGRTLSPERLVEFLELLGGGIVHAEELPLMNGKYYLKTSSWAPDKGLGIWAYDWDNRRIIMFYNKVSKEARRALVNSDFLGWEPLPEKRLEAYKLIYKDWLEGSR